MSGVGLPRGRVWWRGVVLDERTADMAAAAAALVPGIRVSPTQGSWSGAAASAGTHSGCGALDIDTRGMRDNDVEALVAALRRVGMAAWARYEWQAAWIPHIHAVAVQPGGKRDRGCLSSGAHSQIVDYFENRNGLAGRGSDYHTRVYVGVTFEQYKRPAYGQDEDMRIIKGPKRGPNLYGAGYFKPLSDEQYRVLVGAGIPVKDGNDRECDVIRAAVLQGKSANHD